MYAAAHHQDKRKVNENLFCLTGFGFLGIPNSENVFHKYIHIALDYCCVLVG